MDAISGPWQATKIGASVANKDQLVAFIPQGERRKATADLVAAAPELLSACELAYKLLVPCEPSVADALITAIKKARGE